MTHKKEHMIMLPKLFIFFYRAERQLLVFADELASVKSKVYSLIIMSAQGYLVHIAYFQYMVNQLYAEILSRLVMLVFQCMKLSMISGKEEKVN